MNSDLACVQKERIKEKSNARIRKALLDAHMKQWELAELLGIAETSLSRMLRRELSEDIQKKYIAIINENKKDE